MKRIVFFMLLCAMGAGMAVAQNVDTKIAQIRQLYSEAQELIGFADIEPNTRNTFSINIDQMYPGSGPHKEKIDFFFTCLDLHEDDESDYLNWHSTLYLVRHSFNIGGHKYYNEYLYDIESGDPVFALLTNVYDEKENEAVRVYLNKGKVLKIVPSSELDIDLLIKNFEYMKNLFHQTIVKNPLL